MPTRPQRFERRQHMLSSTYEVFRYLDTASQEVALHHHDFYEVYFFLSGNVRYNIESRTHLLSPGDVLLISPMELHQPVFETQVQSYERIVLWINKPYLESLSVQGESLAACFDTAVRRKTNLLRPSSNTQLLLIYHLEQILGEQDERDPYCRISALSHLVQILVLLNRQTGISCPMGESTVSNQSPVVLHIVNYINAHYNEDLSLDTLANRFFTSKYHLSREFQRLVGTSVHRYITQKRLAMAKQMMAQGVSAAEVYQHCGFGDYSTFYRAFKAEYQLSPKQFLTDARTSAQRSEDLLRRLRGEEA